MEQKQLTTVTLILTIDQLNVIISGIVKLSIETGLSTLQAVEQQASQQLGDKPRGPLADKIIN